MSEPITCPACRCKVSSDGVVIFRESKEFAALERLRREIPELRKKIEALEKASGSGESSLSR